MSESHKQFTKNSLIFEDLHLNPLKQFSVWFDEYKKLGISHSFPMTLSTINKAGFPSSRIVFMNELDSEGFIFFTNYNSAKGEEIRENNKVSLLFYWPELERQVRIWGMAEKVDDSLSDAYFRGRPRGSQAGAWVSRQSKEIKNRESLENAHQEFLRTSGDKIIPRPEFWGGYRIIPLKFELWQGRENRLHDRFIYVRSGKNWEIKRLAP